MPNSVDTTEVELGFQLYRGLEIILFKDKLGTSFVY